MSSAICSKRQFPGKSLYLTMFPVKVVYSFVYTRAKNGQTKRDLRCRKSLLYQQ
jgi:hypothetical protein